ncbi:nitrate reductase molybdenum cofactor assembly chaperone [Pelosinus fermentans]|uniref:Nitrate reductase molybdenum cofactor assembly chaperone n=1 Tax=Pelosinus fermentans JBW45 TaxID=1192197 RepID=I9NWE6_9FIRM|nr:nitrate reductase molybdenum cofactor assembly chaperone [Pelosinus fermentans]AJQ28130.1 nitrate reductase molybdenum cofactor assembly chaperone [Pelosinus fermentans JBW45]
MIDKEMLQFLSILLQYPKSRWLEINQLRILANKLEHLPQKENVDTFLDYLDHRSCEELAAEYVDTFDFSEHCNLYITSLLCPDDRKRGQVLADLKAIYLQAGLEVDTEELPDYLPLLLEFLAIANQESCKQVLEIVGPGMDKLWQQLKGKHSPYAALLEVCVESTVPVACVESVHIGGDLS